MRANLLKNIEQRIEALVYFVFLLGLHVPIFLKIRSISLFSDANDDQVITISDLKVNLLEAADATGKFYTGALADTKLGVFFELNRIEIAEAISPMITMVLFVALGLSLLNLVTKDCFVVLTRHN
ncbi:hypothetical protein [Curvivirga sp.]|uniref:hypothetical protein n=1 Tax=Curvivirga sp. TaxID=2856848 RepID=UPI003B59DEE4